jgi:molybdopterin molybdotransferase
MAALAHKTKDMLGRTEVVSLARALELLHGHMPVPVKGEENLPLVDALGRILAREILAPEDLPVHSRSTMDGYAVRAKETYGASENLPAYLSVGGEVRMGEFPAAGPAAGSCFRIATGGLLPPQTDAVVMLEHTVQVDDQMIEVTKPVAAGNNCIAVGEDIAAGELLLSIGHRLRAQDLGMLAGLGITNAVVYRRVRTTIISTGDEIVDYRQVPPPGKIRDMNGVQLAAFITRGGGIARPFGIVADTEEKLTSAISEALAANDLVLFSGSSSVGSRDLGETVIAKAGPPGIIFHGVAIKPGKPVIFAKAGEVPVFGLPGHPVSAAVSYSLFVEPVLQRLSGVVDDGLPKERIVKADLQRNISSAAGRTDFIRVRLTKKNTTGGFEAEPVLGKSGALSSMVRAHGYILIEEKKQGLRQGDTVCVRLYA